MVKTRKSRPKAEPARGGARNKAAAGKSAARAPLPESAPSDEIDAVITAFASVLAFPIEPSWLPAIRTNLEVNLRLAGLVAEFVLPDEAEPAPVFRA
jgi:hypothetical protein